jgi:uncharacterized protein (DUF2141 family)
MSSRKRIAASGAAVVAALAGVLFLASASAQAPAQPVATITVANIRAQQGFILAALYDERGWGSPAVAVARVSANAGQVTLRLAVPAPGRYGVRLFHDLDSDGELDANLMGLPVEPFGFSNDAPIRFGPPSFDEAAFDVGATGAAQAITLR